MNDPGERRRQQAWRFLSALHGGAPEGYLALWLPRRKVATWPPDLATAAAEAIRLSARDEVRFAVAPRRRIPERGLGSTRDVLALPALWADLSVVGPSGRRHDLPPHPAATRALLRDFPLPPSALVRTPHGHQAYWFLDEPLANTDLALTRAVLRELGASLAASAQRHGWRIDAQAFTPVRTMALPGTLDRTEPRPRLVRLEALHPERRYPVGGLRLAAGMTPARVSR